ncbi:MAG: penicillin-binding protein activator [Halothiobacillaceae bacterium]|nr:penicillin-binding protein activator [Halothiobacillaceae bacterium]
MAILYRVTTPSMTLSSLTYLGYGMSTIFLTSPPSRTLPLWSIALLALSLALSGCAPTASRPDTQLELAIAQAEKANDAPRLANALWAKAMDQEGKEAAHLQLRAIETLIDSPKAIETSAAMAFIKDPRAKPAEWQLYFPRRAMLIQAFELLQRNQAAEATRLLNNLPAPLEPGEAMRRLELLAQASSMDNQPLQAVRQRIALDAMLGEPRRMSNQEAILAQLRSMDKPSLEQARKESQDTALSGWLDLCLAERKGIKALDQWRLSYASIPLLPALFEQLKRDVAARKPASAAHIALLLPNDANFDAATRAVLAGVTQAHEESGEASPEVRDYPYNSQRNDFRSQLDAAVQAGATAAIGPLDRPSLQAIATLNPTIPLVALNTLESGNTPAKLVQFGLPPEDEANAIAARMAAQGHRRVLILAPSDTLGERMTQAFSQRLSAEGGSVVAVEKYAPSNGRANDWNIRVQQLLRPQAHPLTGKPAMREDADALFLIARAADARQALPYLRAQGGGDLAVYASSHVYEGVPKPEADRALDGVVFSEMPLMLAYVRSPGQSEPNRFEHAVYSGQPRLYALGFDAYKLAQQLAAAKGPVGLRGQTGQLTLGTDGRIQRIPSWGVFRGGLANPVGSPADSTQP